MPFQESREKITHLGLQRIFWIVVICQLMMTLLSQFLNHLKACFPDMHTTAFLTKEQDKIFQTRPLQDIRHKYSWNVKKTKQEKPQNFKNWLHTDWVTGHFWITSEDARSSRNLQTSFCSSLVTQKNASGISEAYPWRTDVLIISPLAHSRKAACGKSVPPQNSHLTGYWHSATSNLVCITRG